MSTEEAERFAEEPLKDDDEEERLFDLIETEGSPNRPKLLMITQNIKKKWLRSANTTVSQLKLMKKACHFDFIGRILLVGWRVSLLRNAN